MSEEEFGLFSDIWHVGTDMMCQDYVKPAYRLKEKIIKTFKEKQELKHILDELENWAKEGMETGVHLAYECDLDFEDVLNKIKELRGGINE